MERRRTEELTSFENWKEFYSANSAGNATIFTEHRRLVADNSFSAVHHG